MNLLKISVILATILASSTLYAQSSADNIKLNQLGFYIHGPKAAFITAGTTLGRFYLIKAGTRDTVYSGRLGEQKQSAWSSTKTRAAVFDHFESPGTYVMFVPGAGTSYPFQIRDRVNRPAAISALKGFYYIRSDIPLEAEYAGKWARPAGHPDTAVLIHPSAATAERPAGTVISTPGGWYDAGDYNKYIVNSGISTGTLLAAYEDFPSYFDTLKTNIPESANKIPDILDEALYNIRWMLTMQDQGDGGVYHKCTNAAFDGMVMPGVTRAPRYVVQKSTAAALDFAAVTAQAARVFKKFEKHLPGLGDSCLKASVKAWQWAKKNPDMEYRQRAMNGQFKPEITTGAYGDDDLGDEWLWSAAELFATTRRKEYFNEVQKGMKDSVSVPSWSNVQLLAYYTLLRKQNSLPAYSKIILALMKKQVIVFADKEISKVPSSAFNTVMGQSAKDFIWGSNGVAANESIVLINAWLLTKDKRYIRYALTNLDYILGRNATGYCFVTGIGSKPTRHPHHRPSVADGIDDPVPGLLAGGPNPGRQDHCQYHYIEPETAYSDDDCAYASNEIAINWNASLVYLANGIEALQKVAGY